MLSPNDPIENDVDELAFVVARRCPALSRGGLEFCFTRAFEMPVKCDLFDRFCRHYDIEFSAVTKDRAAARAMARGAGGK